MFLEMGCDIDTAMEGGARDKIVDRMNRYKFDSLFTYIANDLTFVPSFVKSSVAHRRPSEITISKLHSGEDHISPLLALREEEKEAVLDTGDLGDVSGFIGRCANARWTYKQSHQYTYP